jgi:hypothetical protein
MTHVSSRNGSSLELRISNWPHGSCRGVSPLVLGAKSTRHVSGACGASGDSPPRVTRSKEQFSSIQVSFGFGVIPTGAEG